MASSSWWRISLRSGPSAPTPAVGRPDGSEHTPNLQANNTEYDVSTGSNAREEGVSATTVSTRITSKQIKHRETKSAAAQRQLQGVTGRKGWGWHLPGFRKGAESGFVFLLVERSCSDTLKSLSRHSWLPAPPVMTMVLGGDARALFVLLAVWLVLVLVLVLEVSAAGGERRGVGGGQKTVGGGVSVVEAVERALLGGEKDEWESRAITGSW